MRGIYSSVTDIRRQVFTEVARMAYEGGDYSRGEELPYKILPGEVSKYRDSIFLERAIVGERLRLSMGLPLRPIDEHAPLSTGIEEAARPEKYYEPPLINIIKFACNACPEKSFHVTDMCQGCLAHPCVEVCPKGAVSIVHGKSVIDQSKCVKCGQCANVCPYGAIHKMERPCAKACGMDAIGSDELGRAKIDYDKCVSCGMCLVNCPFGAIADKSQIFQVIQSINQGDRVIAAVAPAFVGQFGPDMTPEKLKPSMKLLGFDDVVEVAIGADLCTIEEAKDFMREVPEQQPFMATSCCPAWSVMAKKLFPDFAPYISMAMTPMVLTARLLKKEHKNCKVVFIGPCTAKKMEFKEGEPASQYIDCTLTFEELQALFDSRNIDLTTLEEGVLDNASYYGRIFARSGGLSDAVVEALKEQNNEDFKLNAIACDGIEACKAALLRASKNVLPNNFIEGMACTGGCIGGAGCLTHGEKNKADVDKYGKQAMEKTILDAISVTDVGPEAE